MSIKMMFNLDKLEEDYQKYCNKFSPSYLSGSNLYIGQSLKKYILNKPIDLSLLVLLFFWCHRISNENQNLK
jgi:hypothetical protein